MRLGDVTRIAVLSSSERTQREARDDIGEDSRLRWMVGNVRDADRMRRAMHGIDTVIHAAALKRVEVGQENPREMIETNVRGTVNCLNAAEDEGVKRFVFVSTDKAYAPANLYGATKFLAEGLVLAPRGNLLPRCNVVRYGNVAGSTGSVIPVWRRLKAEGKRARLTDPECTRFWMTLRQAADLVLAAAAGQFDDCAGPIVPNLPAYRLRDLAAAMCVEWDAIGLQPGEKLHESMCAGNSSETARRMGFCELQEALAHV